METKKAKVTKVTKFDKKPGYNDISYSIEFENGDKGFYNTKDEDQKRFVVGQVADYQIEEKAGKEGKKYFKVTSPLDEKTAWSGKSGRPQVEPRIQMISFSGSYVKDLIVAGKIQMNDFEKEFDRIYNKMISKL